MSFKGISRATLARVGDGRHTGPAAVRHGGRQFHGAGNPNAAKVPLSPI